jgi:hypothetical protein
MFQEMVLAATAALAMAGTPVPQPGLPAPAGDAGWQVQEVDLDGRNSARCSLSKVTNRSVIRFVTEATRYGPAAVLHVSGPELGALPVDRSMASISTGRTNVNLAFTHEGRNTIRMSFVDIMQVRALLREMANAGAGASVTVKPDRAIALSFDLRGVAAAVEAFSNCQHRLGGLQTAAIGSTIP